MGTLRELYPMPDIDKNWSVPQQFDATFDFEYDEGRTTLMHLYQKGKDMQWDAVKRIDWDLELDPENPMQLPDEGVALHGSPMWDKRRSISIRATGCVMSSLTARSDS